MNLLRRVLDLMLAGSALAIGVPIAAIAGRRESKSRRIEVFGPLGSTLAYTVRRRFPRRHALWALNYLDVLRLVLAGRMSLVGARPVRVAFARTGGVSARPRYARFAARPGLVSSHLLRRRSNIAFDSPDMADAELARTMSLRTYVGTLARFAIAHSLGGRLRPSPESFELMDVRIDNLTMAQALTRVSVAARGQATVRMAFVNADCLNIACRDASYRGALAEAGAVFPDGIGIHYALRWFSAIALRENVNGTDMFPRLAAMMEAEGLSLYLLGAQPGVADRLAALLRQRHPGLRIAGTHHGYLRGEADEERVVAEINASGANVLLVAMGAPAQDIWIARNATRLRVGVAMGVGGLFDFYSGRVARAPQWMREAGLEWTYRLIQEPARMWRRYVIGNPLFLWRAWRWLRQERSRPGASAAIAPGLRLGP